MDAKVMKEILEKSGNITQMYCETKSGTTDIWDTDVEFTVPFPIKCAIIHSNGTSTELVTTEAPGHATITDNTIRFFAISSNKKFIASIIAFS